MNDRFLSPSPEDRTDTFSAPVVIVELSMILGRGLNDLEKVRLKRVEGRISAMFTAAGAMIRVCEAVGEGNQRTIGLIPGLIGRPLVSLPASQFLAFRDEELIKELERQIEALANKPW